MQAVKNIFSRSGLFCNVTSLYLARTILENSPFTNLSWKATKLREYSVYVLSVGWPAQRCFLLSESGISCVSTEKASAGIRMIGCSSSGEKKKKRNPFLPFSSEKEDISKVSSFSCLSTT